MLRKFITYYKIDDIRLYKENLIDMSPNNSLKT